MSNADRLQRRVLMMTAQGVITATKDDGPVHRVQVRVTPHETIDDVPVIQLYGVASHASPGSDAHLLFVTGDRSKGVAVATNNQKARLRNLKPGEVALYTDEGDSLTLQRGRTMTLTTQNLVIHAEAITVVGTVTLQGDLHVSGTITADTVIAPKGHVGP